MVFRGPQRTIQEGARNATLVDQTCSWHLRIKYDPPIIAGEHWDVLIAWKRQYTPSFTEAILNPAISSSRNGRFQSDEF